jgi:hypothetical protein
MIDTKGVKMYKGSNPIGVQNYLILITCCTWDIYRNIFLQNKYLSRKQNLIFNYNMQIVNIM